MLAHNKRLIAIVAAVAILLLIPLVAMQFTHEVKWTLSDFGVAALLLLGTGLACELILRRIRTTSLRFALCTVVLTVLVLVWLELAVGIFGTPFAGN